MPVRSSKTFAIAFAALLLTVACGGSKKSGPSVAPVASATSTAPRPTVTADARPRPAGVPASATQERADRELGARSVPAGVDPSTVPMFKSTSCADGLLTLSTTTVVVYAELPCDRALPESAARPFVGKPVHIRMVVANPAKLFFDSANAGSVEFTVGRIWTAPPA